MLGERAGARMVIRRIGLVLQGGTHVWDCKCGQRLTIDLDGLTRCGSPLHTSANQISGLAPEY